MLIVNADDFGMSPGVNRGIIEAHELGIVTSASFMTRGRAAGEAAAYARERPSLSMGLHVDLAEWCYRRGEWELVYSHADVEDAEATAAEVRAQLESFRSALGGDPTHLDSHQHLHRSDPLQAVLTELAAALGVPLRWFTPGLSTTGVFYGQDGRGSQLHENIGIDALCRVLHALPPGITELICHPGLDSDAGGAYVEERAIECRTLCDPRVSAAVAAENIVLTAFGGIEPEAAEIGGRGPPTDRAVTSDTSEADCKGATAVSSEPEIDQQPKSLQPELELLGFSHRPVSPGVSLLVLEAHWLADGELPRAPLALVVGEGDRRRRLTELPSWGGSSPHRAGPGDPWRLEFLVLSHRLEETGFALVVGEGLVLELAPPRPVEDGLDGSSAGVAPVAVRAADAEDRRALGRLLGRPEAELQLELEQRVRMTDALEAQNRALRARMAELEDALERAQHAAALAGQLQELIDAEAGVSQARSEFDAARDALQSGIFSAGEGDVEELQRIGEHERRARHALEEQVQGLEQARSGVIRTLPESV